MLVYTFNALRLTLNYITPSSSLLHLYTTILSLTLPFSFVQAYWDVASRRLIDNVCMAIEMEFTSKVVKQVEAQCFMYSVSLDKAIIEKVLVLKNPTLSLFIEWLLV